MFRLHGDRKPETITSCGRSGAPNEVWHYGDAAYKSITSIMHLRESLREYVSDIMLEANRTGVPGLRPLFLEFPNDAHLWKLGGHWIEARAPRFLNTIQIIVVCTFRTLRFLMIGPNRSIYV